MAEVIRFSIVTVTFNAENVIARTIESVINQNRSDCQYIFIDGGSADNTNRIIDEYELKLHQKGITTKHISEPDKGISDAFNKGILQSEGEIVVILNADDELLPGALDRIDVEMDENTDIVYGNCQWINNERNVSYVRKSKADPSGLMYAMVLIHPATFVRKSMYDKYGLFRVDYKYSMDRELLVRMLRGGARFKYVDFLFSAMKAGGVSDKNFLPVLKEGDQIPRMYGGSELKIRIIGAKKYLKHKLSHFYRYTLKRK